MRPTKSKEKLRYHKKLLCAEKQKWQLEKECRESKEYVPIPKTLVGYKVKLVPIESLNNLDEGLAEAVEAASSWFTFSEKPFRFCNLKSYKCEFNNRILPWDFSAEEKMKDLYFKDKLYKKGQLKLLDISEESFQKLSMAAKKYFVQGCDRYDARGNAVYIYHPAIPRTYLREHEEKLFWNWLSIPNSEAQSEAKKISNWLDRKKECQLWHYQGYRTSWHLRWEKKKPNKQLRAQLKEELLHLRKEFEAGVTGGD